MCGISGLHHKLPTPNPSGEAILDQMNETLLHRGPDGSGLEWMPNENFGLAHRRLAIIDLTPAGAQPMCIDQRYWLSFNGEIYNYLELRSELLALGARFQSASDAEVLLQAYIYWGADCLQRFNGMWAFAIFDKENQTLFCARDPYGVKPFYYLDNEAHFGFASEIKALLKIPSYQPIANRKALLDYFANSKIERQEEGFFKDIKELQPGHILRYQLASQTLDIKRYHHPSASKEPTSAPNLRQTLEQAVSLRLRADVPLGFCLSGGLDSSTLLYLAAQIQQTSSVSALSGGLHAFTAVHDSPLDERAWAAQMIAHTKATWHTAELNSSQLLEALPQLIYHQDIPLLSTSTFAQSSVMQSAAEQGIKILIDGQGGDELFAGYQVFYPTFFKELFWNGKWGRFVKEWQQLGNSPSSKKYIVKEWSKDLLSLLPQVLQKRIWRAGQTTNVYLTTDGFMARKRFSKLQEHLAYYCQANELKSLLRWEDRCSMQYSIESRTPFADDTQLMAQARELSATELIHGGWSKYKLRQALDGELPPSISWRRDKKGFSVPESQWLMETATFWQEHIRSKAQLDKSELINKAALLKALPRIFSSTAFADEQNFVFRYVSYLIWIEQFNISNFN
jgi:asparagine synthase (glutamine-hydrolysing)